MLSKQVISDVVGIDLSSQEEHLKMTIIVWKTYSQESLGTKILYPSSRKRWRIDFWQSIVHNDTL